MLPNDTIQAINKNIPEAYKQQYINNINMYKPALDTIDLASKRFKVSKNGIRNGMSILNKYFNTVMLKVKYS